MRSSLTLAAMLLLAASGAQARQMTPTIYDDGISCPGNCDAHVVMNAADNGTINAFRPGSSRPSPKPCAIGSECTICFDDSKGSCMDVTYRGGGPIAGRFDFTPAFYAENCARPDVPDALKDQCRSLDRQAASHGYTKAINCLAEPDDAKCKALIASAKAAQDADIPKREACLKLGEAAYNKAQADPTERRTNECDYTELLLGGTGSKHWHKLLPGACRAGTYVDQFGLDCCSSDIRFAAVNHPECVGFFPPR